MTKTNSDGSGHVLFCTNTFFADFGERLAMAAPGLEIAPLDANDTVTAADLDRITLAFMSRDAWPQRAEPFITLLRQAPALDWFHVMSAGVDGPVFDELLDRNVRVTRSAGASAHAMAETVFMFLHGLARDLRGAPERFARREFAWQQWRELEGRRIAVLGYGPVGRRVTDLAMAYGMHPTIVRRHARGDEPCPTRPLSELGAVVADHDVIVIALPHNADTDGLISRELIAQMDDSTLFVNVARGALVDQRALTDALTGGRLAGAGLDVFDVEPLPDDDPLWDLPNVLITPHNSGSSHGSPLNVIEIFFENLGLYLAGERMRHELPD
jgi:D-2-hydroxyacid dehydrogenase (NADP+)